jgi:hypothetical protein
VGAIAGVQTPVCMSEGNGMQTAVCTPAIPPSVVLSRRRRSHGCDSYPGIIGTEDVRWSGREPVVMAKRTNRLAWGLVTIAAAVVLAGVGRLTIQLRPYWVARHRGYLAKLERAALPGAPLAGADLRCADLRRTNLRGAHLQRGYLKGASLAFADLTGADMRGAQMWIADLTGAHLERADLTGANLHMARLRGADLRHATLRQADLRGANLTGSDMTGATLTRALYDARTRWPAGFNPRRHGAVKVEQRPARKR